MPKPDDRLVWLQALRISAFILSSLPLAN